MWEAIMRARNSEFDSFHPFVNLVYFTAVIAFAMFIMHPAALFISLVCGVIYSVLLKGKRAVAFNLLFLLPLIAATALLNPAFNHEGVTVLAYLPSGNPLTFESIFYGIAAGTMLASVICWFSCFNEIMTSDKFVYLFGKAAPSLSLVLSMTLRFVPRFKLQLSKISQAQKSIGRSPSSGKLIHRLKCALTVLSIMITWVLENAADTADSMKSRGYGTGRRTAFSIYKFDKRDKAALIFLTLTAAYILISLHFGGMYFRFFPSVKYTDISIYTLSAFTAYFALCIMPVIIEISESIKWKK